MAVVDQNGLVRGISGGRATISATAKKEGYNLAFKGEAIVNVIISEALCPFISGYSLWARVYGGQRDDFGTFKRTSDGGYIIVGQTFGAGGGDLLLMKLDSNGNIQWQKTYGEPGYDWAYDVEETQDGGYIVGGGTGSFGAARLDMWGWWDMWILKLDSHGNVQWQKTYGGWGVGIDGLNAEYVHDLLQTSDGGYIVVGGITSYGGGDRDIWALKLYSNGDIPGCGFLASANVSVIDVTSLIYVSVPNPVIGVPPFSGIDSNALIQEIDFACSLLLQCIW